jgi:hypothetical protein
VKLSTTQERNLRNLYAQERSGNGLRLSITEARALERRGLITARIDGWSGMRCLLTSVGRRIAREL